MPNGTWHLRYPDLHRDARAAAAARARGGLAAPRTVCPRCGRAVGVSPSGIGLSAHKDRAGNWCR